MDIGGSNIINNTTTTFKDSMSSSSIEFAIYVFGHALSDFI